jgi:hypothetical protein
MYGPSFLRFDARNVVECIGAAAAQGQPVSGSTIGERGWSSTALPTTATRITAPPSSVRASGRSPTLMNASGGLHAST